MTSVAPMTGRQASTIRAERNMRTAELVQARGDGPRVFGQMPQVPRVRIERRVERVELIGILLAHA
jgi:hypothetical protein